MQCNDMSPFSSSVGERKIMNHFGVGHCFRRRLNGRQKIRANLCRESPLVSSFYHHCNCLASADAERGDPLSFAEIVHAMNQRS